MSRLFDISSDFEELFDQFEAIDEMEFDTDENGNPVDANGNIVNLRQLRQISVRHCLIH